jgi:hypothetical protein
MTQRSSIKWHPGPTLTTRNSIKGHQHAGESAAGGPFWWPYQFYPYDTTFTLIIIYAFNFCDWTSNAFSCSPNLYAHACNSMFIFHIYRDSTVL